MMVMVMEVLIAHYLLIPISLAGYKVPEKRRSLIKAKQGEQDSEWGQNAGCWPLRPEFFPQ